MVVLATAMLFFTIHNGWITHRLFFWWKQRDRYIIRKWEGVTMLACYIAYMAYIGWRG